MGINKRLIVTVSVLVVLIGAGFTYLLLKNNSTHNPAVVTPAQTPESTPGNTQPEQPTQPSRGAYVPYSKESVAMTEGTKILFFHAAWCPQCRQLEADIKAGNIPQGVTIFKVDYDNSQDLRQKYGVTLQTTLVKIDNSGNLLKKFVAYDNPTLQALITNLL